MTKDSQSVEDRTSVGGSIRGALSNGRLGGANQSTVGFNPKQAAKTLKFMSEVTTKLSSEWKNIYRSLIASDPAQRGVVKITRFNQICSQFNVFLSNEEIRKLAQLSVQDDSAVDTSLLSNPGGSLALDLNYVRLSRTLGLHKNSLNLIQTSQLSMSHAKAVRNIISKVGAK